MGQDGRCPRCGAEVAADAPEGLCPTCLLGEVAGPARGRSQGSPDGGRAEGTQSAAGGAPAPSAGAEDAPPVESLKAERPEIPRYRIVRLIGIGGMGAVYEAEQEQPRRTVALKVIRPHLATPQVLRRFAHEAEVLGRLQHPGIAQIHESGTAETRRGPRPFFAMEFVRGPGGRRAPLLTEYAEQSGLNTRRRLELMAKVADAVQYAHQKGVIHRDLKPANILVDETGQPKILDFGVARITESDIQAATMQTDIGQILGTLPYMSPEQAGGDPAELDTRSDVYALGVTCYELLSGRLPHTLHRRMLHEAVRMIRDEEPTRLSSVNRAFRGDIETIVAKALAKDKTRRYQSAAELAADIRRYLGDEPIVARRPSAWYQLRKFAKRNKALVGGIAGVFVALVFGIVGTTMGLLEARSAQQEEATQRRRAEASGQAARQAEQVATQRLWQSYLAQARAGRWSGRAGQTFDSLDALAAAAAIRPARELRDEAVACMALADLRPGRPLGVSPKAFLTLDPTGAHYARDDGRGNTSIRRMTDHGERIRLAGPGPRRGRPVFSPNGRMLAQRHGYGSSYKCRVSELQHGRLVLEAPVAQYGWVMEFVPWWRRIAIGGPDKSVRLYDLGQGKLVKALSTRGVPGWVRCHPRRTHLAVVPLNGSMVEVFDWTTGKVLRRFSHSTKVYGISWRPDGRLLAAACGDFNVHVWNADSGGRQAVLRGHQAEVTGVAFDHAGDLLASRSWDGTVRLWNPVSGRPLVRIDAYSSHLQFTPDDGWLLSTGTEAVQRWQVARPACRTFHELGGATKGPWCVAYSPDGRLLASASDDGVRLWDPIGRGKLWLTVRKTLWVGFDPIGGSLVTSGFSGLRRWPIAIDDRARTLRLGPPTMLREHLGSPGDARASLSPRTGLLAVVDGSDQVAVWDVRRAKRTAVLRPHRGVSYVAISADGRWVATGTWNAPGVKIWDARNGKLVRDLPGDCRRSQVAFSPDGRWLATSTDREYQLWEVGSWRAGRRFPRARRDMAGPVAFSPDGRILAIAPSRHLVHLIDPPTGERLAILESPEPGQLSWFCFSPDGGELAAASADHRIQRWDLRAIRRRLAAMGLDWDLPAYPPAGSAPSLAGFRARADMTPRSPAEHSTLARFRLMLRNLLPRRKPHTRPATAPARDTRPPAR